MLTTVLAVIGAAGTVYTIISTLIFQRRKLSVAVHSLKKSRNRYVMFVSITNYSRLPISVLDISLALNGRVYRCNLEPTRYSERTETLKNQVIDHIAYYSMPFPVTLSSLAATSGYLCFDSIPKTEEVSSTDLILQVSTNRGRASRMRLCIPDPRPENTRCP